MQDTIFEATPVKLSTSDLALSFSSPSLTYNPSLYLLLFILIHWTLTKQQILGLFLFSVSQGVLSPIYISHSSRNSFFLQKPEKKTVHCLLLFPCSSYVAVIYSSTLYINQISTVWLLKWQGSHLLCSCR